MSITDQQQAPAPTAKRNWFARHKVLTGLGAGVLVIAIASGASGSSGSNEPTKSDSASSSTPSADETKTEPKAETKTEPKAEETKPEAPAAPEEPSMTVAQENATEKAEDYLSMTAFSRSGLIKQLEFEGFSKADATYGVDHIDADWRAQAAKKAADYLEMTAFSRSGLIQQLEFEGFTAAQAQHGADAAGL